MYAKALKTSIVLVYLVIVAGAVVRMTGSGMGCPDWPRCFGYWIPPTEASELRFQSGREYKKGQVIIMEGTLQVAQSDFTSGNQYNPEKWATYPKHDYAEFNPAHTWVEYVNRLAGALAGIAVFVMAMASFRYRKTQAHITLLSWAAVLLMGFQGWLGATVVYSVLAPAQITIHMLVALIIVALLLYLRFIVSDFKGGKGKTAAFQNLLILTVGVTLFQIILGTQVRQFVDEQIKLLGDDASGLWLDNAPLQFYLHRSFSILVVGLNFFLWWINRRFGYGFTLTNHVMLLLILEALTGVAMPYLDFPFGSQALHLVLAAVLFGVQFYLLLQCLHTTKAKDEGRMEAAY